MPLPITIDEETLLIPVRSQDASEIFEETDRSRSYLRQWLPWLDGVKTVDDTRKFIELAVGKREKKTGLTLVIRYRKRCAGLVDLHDIDSVNRCAKMGYWLGRDYQGKGIMTRAVEFLARFGLEEMELNRLEIRVAPQNLRSKAIPQRLGFMLEGKLAEAEWLYRHFIDHEIYGMTRRRWDSLHG